MTDERLQPDDPLPRRPRRDVEEAPPRAGREGDDFDEDDRPHRRRRSDDEEGDATGGIIPYKNPAALVSYYLGVFSLIPGLGCLLAPLALIFGIVGFLRASSHPRAKGKPHAIIGVLFAVILAPALWVGIYFLFDRATKP